MSPEGTMKKKEFLFILQKFNLYLFPLNKNNEILQPCRRCPTVKLLGSSEKL